MKVIGNARELHAGDRKVCVAIGMFDGVHLGHQQVIRQTVSDAQQHHGVSLVVTFDRHPNAVVAPERKPPLIYSLSQKLRAIESLSADAVLLIQFTREFSLQTGEQFIRRLAEDLGHLYSVCVGSTFTFGHKRSGNVALLKSLGEELHFMVHGQAAVSLNGRVVSSTRIRETIQAGQLDGASQMLGRTYSVAGTVSRGDALGQKLGFPTANIATSDLLLPPNGVYAVQARTGGKNHAGVANVGTRPTLKQEGQLPRLEVHLLDFDGSLYDQEMEVCFVEKFRGEQRFESLEHLKAQIALDVSRAKALLE